ncbi:MAG TPA: hypothetical protein VFG03_17150 [Telluria sp.]|nr:hypothetical protein [Telluria sp.]
MGPTRNDTERTPGDEATLADVSRRIGRLETLFEQFRSELEQFKAQLEQFKAQLDLFRSELRDVTMRVVRLETSFDFLRKDIENLHTDLKDLRKDLAVIRTVDFRILMGMIISLGIGMGALVAKGFGWI